MSETTVVLAECKGLGRIYLCSCESVHLKVGPVTLCLAPEAFAQATAMMREALEELDHLAQVDANKRLGEGSLGGMPVRTQFMN
jgi:hypothetical protein